MASKEQTISVTLLAVTSTIGVYTSLLPPFKEVRQAVNDPATTNDVHMAEMAAGAVAVAVGLTASSLAGSPVPAMASVVAAVSIALMYESVLRSTPAEKKTATK
jgi:hypothetical protein